MIWSWCSDPLTLCCLSVCGLVLLDRGARVAYDARSAVTTLVLFVTFPSRYAVWLAPQDDGWCPEPHAHYTSVPPGYR